MTNYVMPSLNLKGYFALIFLSILLTHSCNSDDDQGENTNTQNMEEIRTTMTAGTWKVVLYNDSGVNETSDYDGYSFTFNSDGSLEAVSETQSYNGTWSVTEDDDSNDDSNNDNSDIDFNIAFSSPEILVELTDDWDIEQFTATRIELFDISGGDGSTDLLTFQKN